MGTTRADGRCRSVSGETIRENAWGRDREYVVAFLSGGSPQHPLVEFVAADDDFRPFTRARGGYSRQRRRTPHARHRRHTARGHAERLQTQIYNERVVHPGVWNKTVVVAREDDHATMLNHALIQSRRRYGTELSLSARLSIEPVATA